MPGSNSIAVILSKGQRLAAAIAQNGERLNLPEPQKGEFDQALAQFLAVLVRRDNLKAEKQELSRQLLESSVRLQTATIDTKALIRALMGSTSERLTEFQMKPRRQMVVADRTTQKATAAKRARRKQNEEAAVTRPTATPAASAATAGSAAPVATAETQG